MTAQYAPSRKNRRGGGARAEARAASQSLCQISKEFYQRGWALGTSGNFSAVVRRVPLRLAITPSGVDKGSIAPSQIVLVNEAGKAVDSRASPSAEFLLHLTIVDARGAGAVLHTHSIWSTITSEAHAGEHGVGINGYEMLKGLDGVHTHKHSEWLPIVDNSQDMAALALTLDSALREHPNSHGILLRQHGLYTWGKDLAEAKRHVEILEFLLEVTSILEFEFSVLDCARSNRKFTIQDRTDNRKVKH